MWGISLLAEELSASQEGLCYGIIYDGVLISP